MFKVDIKMPDLNKVEVPFECPACKQTIKVMLDALKKLKECPNCKTPIAWK